MPKKIIIFTILLVILFFLILVYNYFSGKVIKAPDDTNNEAVPINQFKEPTRPPSIKGTTGPRPG